MIKKLLLSAILTGLFVWSMTPLALAEDIPLKLNEHEAQQLVRKALSLPDAKDDTGALDPDTDDSDRPFFVFHGLHQNGGSYGYFIVNPWTGDVWDSMGCHRLTTAALRKEQKKIRRRFTAEEDRRYASLHNRRPICITD